MISKKSATIQHGRRIEHQLRRCLRRLSGLTGLITNVLAGGENRSQTGGDRAQAGSRQGSNWCQSGLGRIRTVICLPAMP